MLRCFSCVQLFATPWIVALLVPLSLGFSRQEYCSGLPCPPPGHLPKPGIEPTSLKSSALAGRFFTTSSEIFFSSLVCGRDKGQGRNSIK